MKHIFNKVWIPIFCVLILLFNLCVSSKSDYFPSFTDEHTVALWLFDETEYNYTTLLDAGEGRYDLKLMPEGHLTRGKFGHCLSLTGNTGHAIFYAGFAGKIVNNHIRRPDGVISGLWGPTEGPERLLTTLAEKTWTHEFWLRIGKVAEEMVLFDIGQGYDPGLTVILNASENLKIVSSYSGISAIFPTDISLLADGEWHHHAIMQDDTEISYFLDGKKQVEGQISTVSTQSLPNLQKPENREHEHRDFYPMTYDQRRLNRFNLTIGHVRAGGDILHGQVDEMRFSDVIRYKTDFNPPSSFARKSGAYGAKLSVPARPTGPSPLFALDQPEHPVPIGFRKYLFVDDAIVDTCHGVHFQMNPPGDRQEIDFKPNKSSWRPTVVDIDDKVYLYVPEGYDSEKGRTFLYTSSDGIHFTEHKSSPVIRNTPLYGTFFEDRNPDILPEERYKLTSWVGNRGIHLYFSPDGLHWRRNETLILPLVSGGSAETFYDDQKGKYVLFIRRDTSFRTPTCPGGSRQCIMFETREPTKTWPFVPQSPPYYEGWTLPAVTCEGPAIFDETESGQAYRSRAIKYPWAPDVYLSFVWRFPSDQGDDPARHVDLGVSRDGSQWTFFEPSQGWYIPTDGDPDPEQISIYGLIRRGDEIWQYTNHGGPHGGSPQRTYYRWKQRLDGFVSIDGTGTVITKPLVFEGDEAHLILNSTGSIKIAILDQKGEEVSGFGISDCDPVSDSVWHIVSWSGKSDLTKFSREVIQLKFELQNTKLYSMQFVE